jgi:hypothetical protein
MLSTHSCKAWNPTPGHCRHAAPPPDSVWIAGGGRLRRRTPADVHDGDEWLLPTSAPGLGSALPTSEPGLGSPLWHLRRGLDAPRAYLHGGWPRLHASVVASPLRHLHRRVGSPLATSAVGLGSPVHIYTWTGRSPSTSAPGLGSPLHICAGTGLIRRRPASSSAGRADVGRACGAYVLQGVHACAAAAVQRAMGPP